MIELNQVSHAYDGETVLKQINWLIETGDRWGVIGSSGSGKTTLMRIASGYEHPNQTGTVTIKGDSNRNLARWRRTVGWLSTDLMDKIPSSQSVLNTVLAGKHSQTLKAARSGIDYTDEDTDNARRELERINLSGKVDESFGSLSQGERQLVLVARCRMDSPELIVLDEPCAGLDPGAREQFLGQLDGLLRNSADVTVIYVTHHVEELLPEFTQVLALKNGEAIMKGDRESVLTEDSLEEIYGRRFILEQRNDRIWPAGIEHGE
jgi:iron complex transport system ATP-binding protein